MDTTRTPDTRGVSIAHCYNGRLLDATSIQWYNDAEDVNPLPPASSEVSRSGMYTNGASDIIYFHKNNILGTPVDTDGFQPVLGCGHCAKNTGAMSSAIKKLGEDDDGQPMQATHPHKRTAKRVSTPNKYSTLDIEETSGEDSDFSDYRADYAKPISMPVTAQSSPFGSGRR